MNGTFLQLMFGSISFAKLNKTSVEAPQSFLLILPL